jgi:PKD repeat protein
MDGRELLIVSIFFLSIVGSFAFADSVCYNSVVGLSATCTGGSIGQDIVSGTCRSITCIEGTDQLAILACDKPDQGAKTYFEMYKQSHVGTTVTQLCVGTTCIRDNGYAKSQEFPICMDNSSPNNNTLPGNNSNNTLPSNTTAPPTAELRIAPWYPKGNDCIFVCDVAEFTPTAYDWSFGDGDKQRNTQSDNVYHTYQHNGTYDVMCTAKTETQKAIVTLQIVVGTTAVENSTNATVDTNSTNVTNNTSNATTCYVNVNTMPATCEDGSVTQDVKAGCRTIACSSNTGSITVLACNKPGDHSPQYFEMYRQSQAGIVPKLCLGRTCIQQEGYVRSANYPICIDTPGSEIGTSSGAQEDLNLYAPPGIPFAAPPGAKGAASTTPLVGNLNFDAYETNHEVIKAQIYFNFTTALSTDHTVKFTWQNLDTNNAGSPSLLVIPAGTIGEYGVFATIGKKPYGAGEIDQPGHYAATFQLQGTDMNVTRTITYDVTGTQPTCSWCSSPVVPVAPDASVDLSVSPYFPADYNVAFECSATQFTPTHYTFDFGDGSRETRPVYDIYHTYTANGTYTVTCTATDGTNTASDTVNVSVTMPFTPNPLDRYTMTLQLTAEVLHDRAVNMTCQPVGFRRADTVTQWQFFGDGPNQGYHHPGAINTNGSGSFGLDGIQFQQNTPLTVVNTFPTAGDYFSLCSVVYYDPQYRPDYYDYTSDKYHNIACPGGCQMAVTSRRFSIPAYEATYSDGDACIASNTTNDFMCTGTNETCAFDRVDRYGQTVGYWGTNKSRVCHEGYWFPLRYWN